MNITVNENISLQSLAIEHAAPLLTILQENLVAFSPFLNWPNMPETVEDMKWFIDEKITRFEQGLGPHFAILYEGKVVGMGGFHEMDLDNKVGGVGCWLDSQYYNKGIATKAAKKVLAIGFDEYDLARIEIKCTAKNLPSRTIAQRLGFSLAKTIPQAAEINGEKQDVVIFSLPRNHLN